MAPNPTLNQLINQQELNGFVRELTFDSEFPLKKFLPEEQLQGNEFQSIVDNRVDIGAARHRALDTSVPLRARQAVGKLKGELAPIGEAMLLTEEQTLKMRAWETGNYRPILDQIYDDLGNLTRGVQVRYELDRGRLLSTGKVTLHFQGEGGGPGFDYEVDFGLAAGNKVTAATLWSDVANADIISHMNLWLDDYALKRRGRKPGVSVISTRIAGYLRRNAALRSLLYPNGGSASVLSMNLINAEMDANGFPPFVVIDEQLVDQDGVTQKVLDDNKVIFLPTDRPIGKTFLGVTAESLGMVEEGTISHDEAPGIVGFTYTKNNPPRRWNQVASMAMPVPGEINDLYIATVAS